MSFSIVWERIISSTEIKKMVQLADLLDVSQQFISKKKKEDSFPIEWAYKVAQKYDLLTEWILTGKGPKSLNQDRTFSSYQIEILNDLDQWLSELIVNQPYRKEWFRGNLEDAFPMFTEWKKRRDEENSKDRTFPDENVA